MNTIKAILNAILTAALWVMAPGTMSDDDAE